MKSEELLCSQQQICILNHINPIYDITTYFCMNYCNNARYVCVINTNFIHYISSVYFINQPLHVSGIFVAHHKEVYCIYTARTNCSIYTVYLMMMDYKYAENIWRLIDEINWGKIVQVGFYYTDLSRCRVNKTFKKKMLGTLTYWIAIISFNMHVHPSFWLHAVT